MCLYSLFVKKSSVSGATNQEFGIPLTSLPNLVFHCTLGFPIFIRGVDYIIFLSNPKRRVALRFKGISPSREFHPTPTSVAEFHSQGIVV